MIEADHVDFLYCPLFSCIATLGHSTISKGLRKKAYKLADSKAL